MPLFEYTCKECNKTFELLVKNADVKVTCPECGSKKTEKSLSHFAPLGASSGKRLNMGCVGDCGNNYNSCSLNNSGGCCGCNM
ncbi:MAG TPA: zinc ribbon domain-containing protein [Candidatus Hydrogenedens sp.]|nr:zinc ribbon domain-containing protein [Candidatus Hydrogenedens sp.]HOL18741.1 zinc ribbon domain-containing protein [Candidatus Hydrogenedens sp.]HPP59109.1 zinc ribbon domain-containing protein [Candidatus Hydrogenedens sp.]